MKTDKEIIDDAFKKACKTLNIKCNYTEQSEKILFLRMYAALDVLNGSDVKLMQHWLNQYNTHLMYTPSQMIHKLEYLNQVTDYVEGYIQA
jgi:hypothetical protein